jgi:hypothetical protein
METIKVSLVDNDSTVHALAQLAALDEIQGLIRHLNEDFIQGEEAYLEVEGPDNRRTRYAISRIEAD